MQKIQPGIFSETLNFFVVLTFIKLGIEFGIQ